MMALPQTATMSTDSTAIPSHCYLRVSVAGGPPQNVVIQFYKEQLPITCHNFAALCAAHGTTSKKRPIPTYRGTEFHRVVKKFMVQGGDFENFDGTGGYSSYGGTFQDEGLGVISHNHAGIVSMANRGKHTNGSQFFITLESCPHLDTKHVSFGQVVEGMNVIHEMANVELEGTRPVPMQRIVIVECGEGRGPVEEKDSNSSDVSNARKRKKRKEKKRKKHRSKRRKRERHSDDDSSLSSSDDSRCRRKQRRKSKKHKRRRQQEYSSGSDEYSTAHRRKSKAEASQR